MSSIYKNDPRSNPDNYRPISLTSLVCKVLEHIICSQFCAFFSSNSIISTFHHCFRSGLSCETQLISLVHEWSKVLNERGQVDVVFLDFAKAFDSVLHQQLLSTVDYYGIRDNLQLWLKDFLTDRRQRVFVNGSFSNWSPVKSGVPQGTVLGPILFFIYINDLFDAISSSIKLFSDDAVIYKNIGTPDDHLTLQNDLLLLEAWASRRQMRFSPTKCHTLPITLKKNQSDFTYNLCNTAVEGVRCHKHLGVYITCTLNWSKQCEEVQKKANRVLAVLQRNIHSAPPKVEIRAYQTLERPITEYACAVWCPHTAKGIAIVESVQRRAARFVFNGYQRSTSASSLIERTKLVNASRAKDTD